MSENMKVKEGTIDESSRIKYHLDSSLKIGRDRIVDHFYRNDDGVLSTTRFFNEGGIDNICLVSNGHVQVEYTKDDYKRYRHALEAIDVYGFHDGTFHYSPSYNVIETFLQGDDGKPILIYNGYRFVATIKGSKMQQIEKAKHKFIDSMKHMEFNTEEFKHTQKLVDLYTKKWSDENDKKTKYNNNNTHFITYYTQEEYTDPIQIKFKKELNQNSNKKQKINAIVNDKEQSESESESESEYEIEIEIDSEYATESERESYHTTLEASKMRELIYYDTYYSKLDGGYLVKQYDVENNIPILKVGHRYLKIYIDFPDWTYEIHNGKHALVENSYLVKGEITEFCKKTIKKMGYKERICHVIDRKNDRVSLYLQGDNDEPILLCVNSMCKFHVLKDKVIEEENKRIEERLKENEQFELVDKVENVKDEVKVEYDVNYHTGFYADDAREVISYKYDIAVDDKGQSYCKLKTYLNLDSNDGPVLIHDGDHALVKNTPEVKSRYISIGDEKKINEMGYFRNISHVDQDQDARGNRFAVYLRGDDGNPILLCIRNTKYYTPIGLSLSEIKKKDKSNHDELSKDPLKKYKTYMSEVEHNMDIYDIEKKKYDKYKNEYEFNTSVLRKQMIESNKQLSEKVSCLSKDFVKEVQEKIGIYGNMRIEPSTNTWGTLDTCCTLSITFSPYPDEDEEEDKEE